MDTKISLCTGHNHKIDNRVLSPFRLWLFKQMTRWLPESRFFQAKARFLRWCGARVGNNVRIYSSVNILGSGVLEIADDVHIGPGTRFCIAKSSGIFIGSHVDIAPEVMIITGSHAINKNTMHIGDSGSASSIEIGDGSWICARAVILSGVQLPTKTVVAAGAVVTKTIDESGCLLAGCPAIVKKHY